MATTIATATASFMVIADCEACSHPYHWTVAIEHKEYSGFMGRIKDPRGGLAMKLMSQGIPMLKPCPKCGYTQSYMHSTWESMYKRNWFMPVILAGIGILFAFMGMSMASEKGDATGGWMFGIVGGITALLAIPSGMYIARELEAGPNRKWHKKHGSEVPAKKDVRVEPTTSGMTVCPSCRQQTKGKLNSGLVPIIIFFCALPIVCMWLRLIPWEGIIVWMLLAGFAGWGCVSKSRSIKAFWPSVTCNKCKHTWKDEC